MTPQNRLVELDCLRGISAIAVVLFHYTYAINHEDKLFGLQYGYLGVDLFFIISGFVIFLSIEKSKNIFDFPISRFLRLFPIYWVGVILAVCWLFLFENIFEYKTILINLTMLQYWFRVKDIDGAYWTLAVELSFYLFMYILFLTKSLKKILLIGSILIFTEGFYYLFDYKNLIFTIFSFLKHWHLFFSGIIFYNIFKKKKIYFLEWLLFVLIVVVSFLSKKDQIERIIEILFLIVFLKFSISHKLFPKFSIGILSWLGYVSYSLYVIHEVLGIGIIHLLQSKIGYFPSRILTLIFILFLAYIITKYLEPTIRSSVNRFLKLIQIE